ncbi:MAG: DUF4339 domain-containing protein [Pseudomonadota bacterium]|nr:DUF4339 domain-containing protein [Pseudomonadota bacterium]
MSSRTFWIVVDGKPDGPHDEASLARRLAARELHPDTGAWHEGLDAWSTLALLAPKAAPGEGGVGERGGNEGAAGGVIEDSVAVVSTTSSRDGEALEAAFAGLVKKSWKHFDQSLFAGKVDEVLLGALITVMVERGSAMIDLTSDGQNHYARFERLADKSRVFFRLTHLTPNVVAAKVQGHLVSVVVGYGEFIDSFATVWSAIKAEYRSDLIQTPEPGTITVDADMNTRYVFVQVDLYWNAGDYVNDAWRIDYEKLGADMDAVVHVLRKYLRGRFRPALDASSGGKT